MVNECSYFIPHTVCISLPCKEEPGHAPCSTVIFYSSTTVVFVINLDDLLYMSLLSLIHSQSLNFLLSLSK